MKKTLATIVLIFITTLSFSQSPTAETEATFGVSGNCGMCKSTIEKAVNAVEGVSTAIWNKETKQISVVYDSSKTELIDLHKAIAKSGYDTELITANDEAYNNLAGCCQYDRKE